jgi:ABC-type multidrug transport system ATPase subunit
MLQITNLTFSYDQHPVITGLSTSIKPGVTFIRGGDGRGKTTLIRLLAGDLQPDSGQLEVDGTSLKQDQKTYRSRVFWIDPRNEGFDQLSASEFFGEQQKLFPNFDSSVLPRLIEGLDLGLHIGKKLFMLSTGSRRKVWIAAAFAACAPVALLDMPFAAVDNISSEFIAALLHEFAANQDRAVVFSGYELPTDVPVAAVIDLGD